MNVPGFHLMEEARQLGAVGFRTFNIVSRRESQTITEKFSFHFFDGNDREICYFMSNLVELGLHKLKTPRDWSEEFKNDVNYSPWQRLVDKCNHCGNVLCDAQLFNSVCFNCGKKP